MKIYTKPAIDIYEVAVEDAILTDSLTRTVDFDDNGVDEIEE